MNKVIFEFLEEVEKVSSIFKIYKNADIGNAGNAIKFPDILGSVQLRKVLRLGIGKLLLEPHEIRLELCVVIEGGVI